MLKEKKSVKLYIYTKANNKDGFGHLGRQLVFYRYCLQKKIECFFLKDDIDQIIYKKLNFKISKYKLIDLLNNKKNNIFLIIDRYDISVDLQKKIARKYKFLIFDNITHLKSKIIYSDIIINIDPSISKKNYLQRSYNDNVKLFLGLDYALVKRPDTKNKSKKIDYLIILGGGNNNDIISNLLNKLLKKLNKKIIMILPGFLNKKISWNTEHGNKVLIKKYVKNPTNYFKQAKKIICGGGSVLLESLPFSIEKNVIVTNFNQVSIVKNLFQKKFISNICYYYKNKKIPDYFINKLIQKNKLNNKIFKKQISGEKLILKEILKLT